MPFASVGWSSWLNSVTRTRLPTYLKQASNSVWRGTLMRRNCWLTNAPSSAGPEYRQFRQCCGEGWLRYCSYANGLFAYIAEIAAERNSASVRLNMRIHRPTLTPVTVALFHMETRKATGRNPRQYRGRTATLPRITKKHPIAPRCRRIGGGCKRKRSGARISRRGATLQCFSTSGRRIG